MDPLSHVADMLAFRCVINDLHLIDLPINNQAFTWTSGRPSPTLERLDRAFISHDWHAHFPRSLLRALPRSRSDHSPLMLTAHSFIPAAHLFKFESFWLRHPAVTGIISTAWTAASDSGLHTSRFASKFDRVTGALKDWSPGLSSALKLQANQCLF